MQNNVFFSFGRCMTQNVSHNLMDKFPTVSKAAALRSGDLQKTSHDWVRKVLSQWDPRRNMVTPEMLGMFRVLCLLAVLDAGCLLDTGMLFPRESSSREVKELNGLWTFRADMSPNRNQGFDRAWYKSRLAEVNRTVASSS